MNIVLVHGMLGFRQKFGLEYFRGIPQHLRQKGLTVFAAELDPTQGIQFRGSQLCQQINSAFASGALHPQEQTHIIAHSMGGLDARYVLSPVSGIQINAPIRSLTTIGTPHLGSPLANMMDNIPTQSAFAALGLSLNGVRDLKTSSCKAFSLKYTDNPRVAYFSVAASGRTGFARTAASLLLLHTYISTMTGKPNDGLVSVDSATWGQIDTDLWPCDHVEMVGYNLDNPLLPPAFPYLAKYDQIIANISTL